MNREVFGLVSRNLSESFIAELIERKRTYRTLSKSIELEPLLSEIG